MRRVYLYHIPFWICGAALAGVVFPPAQMAIHNGQVTPLLCAILAFGIGRRPLVRGLCVGLVCAVKPTFAPLAPFAAIAFGRFCLLGTLLGGAVALIPPSWFMEYLLYVGDITARDFPRATLISIIGLPGSLTLTCLASLLVAWRCRNREIAYILLIGIATIGTALWWHSYTPLIIPICYGIGAWLGEPPDYAENPAPRSSQNF